VGVLLTPDNRPSKAAADPISGFLPACYASTVAQTSFKLSATPRATAGSRGPRRPAEVRSTSSIVISRSSATKETLSPGGTTASASETAADVS